MTAAFFFFLFFLAQVCKIAGCEEYVYPKHVGKALLCVPHFSAQREENRRLAATAAAAPAAAAAEPEPEPAVAMEDDDGCGGMDAMDDDFGAAPASAAPAAASSSSSSSSSSARRRKRSPTAAPLSASAAEAPASKRTTPPSSAASSHSSSPSLCSPLPLPSFSLQVCRQDNCEPNSCLGRGEEKKEKGKGKEREAEEGFEKAAQTTPHTHSLCAWMIFSLSRSLVQESAADMDFSVSSSSSPSPSFCSSSQACLPLGLTHQQQSETPSFSSSDATGKSSSFFSYPALDACKPSELLALLPSGSSSLNFGGDLHRVEYAADQWKVKSWVDILNLIHYLQGVEVTYRLCARTSKEMWPMKRSASSARTTKTVNQWWKEFKQKRKDGQLKNVVSYLTDVTIPMDPDFELISTTDPMVRYFGPYGLCGMHQYLPLGFREAVRKGEELDGTGLLQFPYWVLFISPPTHRRVSTGPHADGHGYHTAVHFVLPSNPNCRNRIQTWNRAQSGLGEDCSELYAWEPEFCTALRITADGGSASDEDQWECDVVKPDAYIDSTCEGRLKKKMNEPKPSGWGSERLGSTTLLHQGQVVVMPAGLLHHFQKELVDPGEMVDAKSDQCRMSEEFKGGPMVGLTGTDVMLGYNEASIQFNINILDEHTRRNCELNWNNRIDNKGGRKTFKPTRMRVDFPLWLGILCTHRYPKTLSLTPLHRQHMRAALPLIDRYLKREQEIHSQLVATPGSNRSSLESSCEVIHDGHRNVSISSQWNKSAVNLVGVLLFCSCVWCGAHVFQRCYLLKNKLTYAEKSEKKPTALTLPMGIYCVECVSAIWLEKKKTLLPVDAAMVHQISAAVSQLSLFCRFGSNRKNVKGQDDVQEDFNELKRIVSL